MDNYLGLIAFLWGICALIAAGVAPRGRQLEFFLLTALILGPLGVGFASVAPPPAVSLPGRLHFFCPRCAASNYAEVNDGEFDCWRCNQNIEIQPRRLGGPRASATTKAKPAAEVGTARKANVSVRCSKCQHIQIVPASTTEYECVNCEAKLKRKNTD